MSLSREAILSRIPVLPREELEVPEWGGTVFVRTISASERDQLEVEWEETKRHHFRARMVWYCCCDETGKDLFRKEDILAIGAQSLPAIDRICEVAMRLNKFSTKAVEDAEKNSPSAPPVVSSSV